VSVTPLRIAVLTGTRADYGLLRGFARAVDQSDAAELQLIVSGTHLSEAHGGTASEIAADGFVAAAEVPVWSEDDSALGASRDTGHAMAAYATTLARLDPDVAVVLGDRLEAVAFALAATALSIPVAHIHGGEVTEGAMDDALRHAITKLASVHFPTTEDHRARIVQLGEDPAHVHVVGAPIVDALAELELMTRAEVETRFGVRFVRPTALVTFHPAAYDVRPASELLNELLDGLLDVESLHIIVTGSNSDIGSADVRRRIAGFVADHPERVDYVESFGQLGYLSAMSLVDVVVGNSSSTVLEAPVIGTPSVLVGDRQKGRPLAASVRTPAPTRRDIADAVRSAISDPRTDDSTLFGGPGFSQRALEVLVADPPARPPRKAFYDLSERRGNR
jgi:UDP-hydrolysing UDP-N-acetyl-D-glucosamine 2-epimerase